MIQMKNIRKSFHTSDGRTVEALKGIDLDIAEGEIFGIIGLSGAGKSTLLRMINRLEEPDGGRVIVDGTEITALQPKKLREARRKIGMIFQHFNLPSSRTVARNIAFPLELEGMGQKEISSRVTEMLDLTELTDKAENYPSALSGGQRQRVAIARALANNPKVLLSDESTSALDPKTTDSILSLLADINRRLNLTIVLVTHEMDVIRKVCHKVAVIEDGHVVEQGPVKDVFLHPTSRTAREFMKRMPRHNVLEDGDLPRVKGFPVVKVTFDGDSAGLPLISQTIRTTGADINILSGNIDSLYSSHVGHLTVQLCGDKEKTDAALEFIRSRGVKAEVVYNG